MDCRLGRAEPCHLFQCGRLIRSQPAVKFIQISDLHLTGSTALLFGSNPEARLNAAVDSLLRDHGDASFCLLTGDLADAGAESAYAALAGITARLPMPVY